MLNWALIKEPVNWVIVALMLAIATFGLHLLLDNPSDNQAGSGSAGL